MPGLRPVLRASGPPARLLGCVPAGPLATPPCCPATNDWTGHEEGGEFLEFSSTLVAKISPAYWR